MKTKSSFILKSSVALILCFLMLFGTMTTSLAAVVDDLAETGATIYYDFTEVSGGVNYWNSSLQYDGSGGGTIKTGNNTNANASTVVAKTATGSWTNMYWSTPSSGYNIISVRKDGNAYDWRKTVTFSEETVLYFKLDKWLNNSGCYHYAQFTKLDGTTTVVPLYNLSSYTTNNNASLSTASTNADDTVFFATIPAGTYFKGKLYRNNNDNTTLSGAYNNSYSFQVTVDNKNQLGDIANDTDISSTWSWSWVDHASTASLAVSENDVEVNDAVTLTPSINNTRLNTIDSTSYTVTKDGSAATSGTDYTISNGTFTPLTAGEFGVTATVTYHAKGFTSKTATADSDEETINVASPDTCTLTLDKTTNQTLNIGETFELTVSSEHCSGSASNLSISSSSSTYVSATLKSTGTNSRTYTIKALKPTSTDVTLTAACSADSDENNPTLKVAVNTPTLTVTYSPASIYVGGSATGTPSVTANNVHSGVTPTSVTFSKSGSAGTINSSTGVVTSSASTTGTVTVTATGTVTYNGVSYTTATGTATVTVKNRENVWLRGLTSDYTWNADDANKMTYNSTTGLYEITRNLFSGSTTYNGDNGFKVYVDSTYYGGSYTLNGMSYNHTTLSTSGGNIYLTTKDLSSVTSNKVPYKFTYNTDTKEVYVYYPMKVTYNMQSHGTNPSANGYVVAYGSTITAPTAPTASGYTFGGWYKEAACTNEWNFSTDTVTADTVLYAKWTTNSHSVTYPTPSNYTLGGTKPTSANYGSTVSFTVTPSSGYRIKSVKYTPAGGSATNCTAGSNNEYHFTMPDADVTVSVEAVRTYTVTVNAGTGGTVASSSITVDSNTATTLPTATPAYGYKFVNWTTTGGTLTSATSASAAKITTTSAVTVTANFAKDDGMSLGIAGRFHVQTTDTSGVWTNTFNSGDWSDTGRNSADTAFNIPFVWDSTEQKYKVETHASLSDLTSNISGFAPYFYVYDNNKSGRKALYAASSSTLTSSNKSVVLSDSSGANNNLRFNDSAVDKPVIIWFDATTKTLSYTVPTFYDVTVTTPTNGTVTASPTRTTEGTEVTLTVTPSTGYELGTLTVTKRTGGQTITVKNNKFTMPADDVTVTATFNEITPTVNFSSYKTDDGSTYSAGGGALTATYSTSSGGGGDPTPDPSAPARYLWKNVSTENNNNPVNYSVKSDFTAATDGNYYTSFSVTAGTNFYFLINDSSTSSTSGSRYIYTTTQIVRGSGIESWTSTENYNYNGTDYRICKGYSGNTVYVKYSPGEDKIYLQNSAFDYTAAGSGSSSGGSSSSTSGTVTSGGTVPYNANVTFTATRVASVGGDMYQFVGWYASAQPVANETALSTALTYTKNSVTSDVSVYARYKKVLYLTFYNSYMRENENSPWKFVAAPPKTVKVGMGSDVRATYTYKAGTGEQRGEEHTVNATDNYYEGNTLLVLVGETVTLNFSSLASSDVIRGIYFNNGIRYTTETEPDNLYLNRVNHGRSEDGGDGTGTLKDPSDPSKGYTTGDDDWAYTYLPATTIFADANYYTGTPASTISANHTSYVADGAMNQTTHSISWVATQSYLNIDVELDYKKQITINEDDWDGLTVTGFNDEGFYYTTEQVGKVNGSGTELKVALDNSDTSRSFAFTGTNTVKDKNDADVSGFTLTPYNSSNQVVSNPTTNASSIAYYLISCPSMPATDVFINLGVDETYNMKLSNVVVTDTIGNKKMITQTNGTSYTSGATGESQGTGHIGTISARVNNAETGTDIAYENSSTYHWYYDASEHGNQGTTGVYENNSNSNNYYLKRGGVNKAGSVVHAGDTVNYKFTFASGMDTQYSFVGWFEGSLSGDTFSVNYNKKLSGKTSFTYTPTKNTVVIAVATRDMYLGGNFTTDGMYTSTSANQTWSSGRILMNYDPTYVNPSDSTKIGRYYYTFDSVDVNTEYKFRVYDTVSGSDFTNLTVWNAHINDIEGYKNDYTDIADYRSKYQYDSDSTHWTTHAGFMFTNATGKSFSEIKVNGTDMSDKSISQNHTANGYGNPVTVYFYAYDSGVSVDSTYQWSMAYVSKGAGVDCTNYEAATGSPPAAATFNAPTVSVSDKTVNNKTVVRTTQNTKYGNNNSGHSNYEPIIECQVQEANGKIVVTASPNDANQELQAFVCYNIDTKDSWAVYDYTTSGSGASKAYIGQIEIPQNSKIYVVPVYKFTDAYIASAHLNSHIVYVRTEDIDKDKWGGLVSMYSWGKGNASSGVWPGQLMIPSDDGTSFYASLTFGSGADDLAGVTFNNYASIYDGAGANFLSTYVAKGVSSTAYSTYDNTRCFQAYDYREPIAIIENIKNNVYGSDDMTLTFALKPGNKGADNTLSGGASTSNDFSNDYSWEYLTDRSGKKRVDLNGNSAGNGTASYYVVCNYTEGYASSAEEYAPATSAHGRYSIDWTVYDVQGTKVVGGQNYMSACYADVVGGDGDFMSYIANEVIEAGQPVDGKSVMIAYENPQISTGNDGNNKTLAETVRYSGQWYTDGVNTLIDVNIDIGIYSDGVYTPSGSDHQGYANGTATLVSGTTAQTGETFASAYPAKVTMKHATDKKVKLSVSTTDNFKGWYIYDEKEEEYKLYSTDKDITPSFNADITYYAFYAASASYVFEYIDRFGNTKQYTAKGTDLTDTELGNGGLLNPTERNADITSKLSGITGIKVFNQTLTYTLGTADASKPYTIKYTASQSANAYRLTVYSYYSNSSTLVNTGFVQNTWNTSLDLTQSVIGTKPVGVAFSDYPKNGDTTNTVFLGWKEYNPTSGNYVGEFISTRANFGYSITDNLTIAPVFGTAAQRKAITDSTTWSAHIDKNVTTQSLTSASTGTIYNDSLAAFRFSGDTGRLVDISDSRECGIIIMAQTADASNNNTYSANFTQANAQTWLGKLKTNNVKSAKMKSATYGEAYAYYITANSLSSLNRVDLVQALDYAKFNGGNYKVMAYYYDGTGYVYSSVTSGTLTAD